MAPGESVACRALLVGVCCCRLRSKDVMIGVVECRICAFGYCDWRKK